MTFPFGHQVTLVKRVPGPKDDYGDDTFVTTEVTVTGAFDPGGGYGENGADTVDTRPSVLLPPGVDLDWTSAVKYAGTTYEVDGPPMPWSSPFTGRQFGVQVKLKAQLRRP